MPASPEAQLEEFLARYAPAIAKDTRACLKKLRARIPGATVIVYDNYNALAIGFASSDKASDAIISVVPYPRWINLFFLQGANLPDPNQLLKGSGSRVRSIRLSAPSDLDKPEINDLILTALVNAKRPIAPGSKSTLIIKSVSAKQRPRRPPV
jgi:hypothetical protein